MEKRIAIVILAAGKSSRMGAIKQLLPWKNTSLLGHSIALAQSAIAADVFVVVGANAKKIILEVQRNKAVSIVNNDWQQGIGTSISCGVRFIQELGDFQAVLFLMGDQPFLRRKHLRNIIDEYKKHKNGIIASSYKDIENPVVPILFDAAYFKELSCLEADKGAKIILEKHKDAVIQIFMNSEFKDVDTPSDYKRYKEQVEQK